MSLPRRLLAEALGTALLLAIVIGSCIRAERLAGGNIALALLANTLATVWAMFELPVWQFSGQLRNGTGLWLAEVVATAGLLLVILRAPPGKASSLVAGFIGAAYWFTSSTSFANPAAVFGRMFSDSFAGIAPVSAAGFVLAELAGAGLGWALHHALAHRHTNEHA